MLFSGESLSFKFSAGGVENDSSMRGGVSETNATGNYGYWSYMDVLSSELTIMIILTLENEFSEIIYILCRGRQNIYSTILGSKFVVTCAANILKIG